MRAPAVPLSLALLALAACKPAPAEVKAALERGDAAAVDQLLADGADLRADELVDGSGRRPLGAAIARGDLAMVRVLLARGADPRQADPGIGGRGHTPLGAAAWTGRVEAARLLLAAGAPVDEGGTEMTPLALAAERGHMDTVALLLTAGAAPDPARDATGYPPVVVAAGGGHLAVVKRLIEAGAPVDRRDILGNTALFVASVHGRRDVADYLLSRGASPMVPNRAGWTPAFAATYNEQAAIRSLFEKAGVTDWGLQQPPADPPSGWGTISVPVVEVKAAP
jgi:ankyrin repeat protein